MTGRMTQRHRIRASPWRAGAGGHWSRIRGGEMRRRLLAIVALLAAAATIALAVAVAVGEFREGSSCWPQADAGTAGWRRAARRRRRPSG